MPSAANPQLSVWTVQRRSDLLNCPRSHSNSINTAMVQIWTYVTFIASDKRSKSKTKWRVTELKALLQTGHSSNTVLQSVQCVCVCVRACVRVSVCVCVCVCVCVHSCTVIFAGTRVGVYIMLFEPLLTNVYNNYVFLKLISLSRCTLCHCMLRSYIAFSRSVGALEMSIIIITMPCRQTAGMRVKRTW